MATFRFFNFHDNSLSSERNEVFSVSDLKLAIHKYFPDRIIRLTIYYWEVDRIEKTDTFKVNVKFLNREGEYYHISVGSINESFAEIEA